MGSEIVCLLPAPSKIKPPSFHPMRAHPAGEGLPCFPELVQAFPNFCAVMRRAAERGGATRHRCHPPAVPHEKEEATLRMELKAKDSVVFQRGCTSAK
jgi:hypothetical protein